MFCVETTWWLPENVASALFQRGIHVECLQVTFSADVFQKTLWLLFYTINYGTIIQAGITCKKIPCYMRDSACRWFIVKKTKIFWSYVKYFIILVGVAKRRILIGLFKWAFLNSPTIFLEWHNKNEVRVSFFFSLLKLLMKKNKVSHKVLLF